MPDPESIDSSLRTIPLRVHQDIALSSQMLIEPGKTVVLLPARAQGLRIKALLAKLEAAGESGNSAWKSYAWELEKIFRSQFGDLAATIFEQNNYQLSEEKARAIEARVQRLELEDSSANREVSNGAV